VQRDYELGQVVITSVMKFFITGRHGFHDGYTPIHYGRDELQIGSTKL